MLRNCLHFFGQAKPSLKGMIPAITWGWIVIFAATIRCHAEEPDAQELENTINGAGLAGILPEVIPPELKTRFLPDDLPESWKPWATDLDTEIIPYFTMLDLDFNEQEALIGKLRKRVETMNRAIADPRYAPIHERLHTLADPLDNHLKLTAAMLDILDQGIIPLSNKTRQRAFDYLRESTRELKAFLSEQERKSVV